MQLSDFSFELPEHLIAKYPTPERGQSQLLVVDRMLQSMKLRPFSGLVDFLQPKDLLIFNDTQVIAARLYGHKTSGGKIELLIEQILNDKQALCHIKSNRAPKIGHCLCFKDDITAQVLAFEHGLVKLEFSLEIDQVLAQIGHIPIPPYFNRPAEAIDRERYQTVYAKHPGAVAAPTAGLHFNEPLMQSLLEHGIQSAFVTLHVGAGTFKPVKSTQIDAHVMHRESYQIPADCISAIKTCRQAGGRVIAVGTTVVRTLETAMMTDATLKACSGSSQLFIRPGFEFNIVDGLITNFHLPKSTLLMMISAFMGHELMLKAYAHAIQQQLRFYSYGDAMLIL